jgi:hypothetical protein
LDATFREQSRRSFTNGLLSEVTFPELDASSRDAKFITLKISPESTSFARSTGATVPAANVPPSKTITGSAFRVTIDGLDVSHVSRIEPITIKMQIGGRGVEEIRDFEKQPVGLQFPTIVLYVSESRSESIAKWHEAFVVSRSGPDNKERNGRIEALTANAQQVVYTLELKNLGITHFEPEALAAEDKSRRIRVEMYVDQIQFKPGTMAQ